ncbi:MAG: sigma-70 family RNA polymerase sigma factor [bacterium]
MEYNKHTDTELMEKLTVYDKQALDELYNRYSKLLFTLIKKIVTNEKMAENILIEIFCIAFKKARSFNFQTDNPYVWFITLARNRAVDSLRRNRNSLSTKEYYDENYEDSFVLPVISKEIDGLDIETALRISPKMKMAFDKLTEIQRHVINMAFYEGFTLNEIAKNLNLPIETIRLKIMTSVFNLRDRLMEN